MAPPDSIGSGPHVYSTIRTGGYRPKSYIQLGEGTINKLGGQNNRKF